MSDKPTHYQERFKGLDLFTKGTCPECGKVQYRKVNHAYGNTEKLKAKYTLHGLLPLTDEAKEREGACQCDQDEEDS